MQRWRLSVWAWLVCALVGCCTSGHGSGEPSAELSAPPVPAVFVSVSLEYGGAGCVGCWRRFDVRAPNTLSVADAAGSERFSLTPFEYESVRDRVTSPEFAAALRAEQPCASTTDGGASLAVTWADGHIQADAAAGGCIRARGASDHPYHALGWLLIDLKRKYVACPPFDSAAVWDRSRPPPVRMLCFACGGEC